VATNFVMYVCPSDGMEKLGYHSKNFHEILCLKIFRKSAKKIQVSLKSDKNNPYFTWKPTYIHDNASLYSS